MKESLDLSYIAKAIGAGWEFIFLDGKVASYGWKDERHTALELAYHVANGGNIGIKTGYAKSRIAVIDLDPRSPVTQSDLPETLFATTGRGVHAYYWVDSTVATWKLFGSGPDMGDLKGEGGYVVAPGSTHPDTGDLYWWQGEFDLARVARFPDQFRKPKVRVLRSLVRRRSRPGEISSEERCWKYISQCPPAISGNGGHNATLRVACVCMRFGLPEHVAMELMRRWNKEKCDPLWSEKELSHKVMSARKIVSASGEYGAYLNGKA